MGRLELVEAKVLKLCFKAGAFKAREASDKANYMFAIEKQMAERMRTLEKAKELGIISDHELQSAM